MNPLETSQIDGSVLEGGGQLLRNAVSLSALLSKPLSISKIRAGRDSPGLKPQHVAGINLVGQTCGAVVEGSRRGSSELTFQPKAPVKRGAYVADPGTAGSTTLLLQVSLPPLIFAEASGDSTPEPSTLKLRGGTNAAAAPPVDHTSHIFLPFLRRHFGIDATLDIRKRGYWPKGGGEIRIAVQPRTTPLPAISLTNRGKVVIIRGRSYVAGLPAQLAKDMAEAATSCIREAKELGLDESVVQITALRETPGDAVGSGSGIFLWAETDTGCNIGGSALGVKGKSMMDVGTEAAQELLRNLEHGGCVDEYLQDQIILYLALAEGQSTVITGPLTLHTKTAIWVAEQLTSARFTAEESLENQTVKLTCRGIGLQPAEVV